MQRVLNPGPRLGVGAGVIGLRTHDLGGTDFEPYLRMKRSFAEGLAAGIPDLHWRYQTPPDTEGVRPMQAKIDLREDPGIDGRRNFLLLAHHVGEDHLYTVGYLDHEHADMLSSELNIPYIGPPEAEYERILMRLKIDDLRAKADALEADLPAAGAPTGKEAATWKNAEERQAEQGWSDLKVAFDVEDTDAIWDAPSETWPTGWKLDETDSSGARYVAVFRVDHLPTANETRAVAAEIDKMEQAFTPSL
ncbi:hypothetical protein KUV57_11110 [Epibacterium sp. DP7N7-1]|nr:hypothetical protein [Epibacterium sp. DP7N7-1]